ncbi:Folylpolyglutamate synthase [Fusarium oxysporum f. sp. albedinis]|nr:Folylpolyglutamate synthase [Fusarium oxysporum f. sp. albedinis]
MRGFHRVVDRKASPRSLNQGDRVNLNSSAPGATSPMLKAENFRISTFLVEATKRCWLCTFRHNKFADSLCEWPAELLAQTDQ